MLLLTGIFLMFQTFLSVKELEPIPFPDEGTTRSEFTLVSRFTPHQLLVVQGSGGGKIRIFNSEGRLLLEHWMPEMLLTRHAFQLHDRFYYFARKLYLLDLGSFSLDSINLRRDDYDAIRWATRDQKELLLASHKGGVDIYDLATMEPQDEIRGGDDARDDLPPLISDDVVVFASKVNELQAYDIVKKKILWAFNTGTQPAYWLGIKVGTFKDFLGSYELMRQDGEMYVVATSFFGNLFKLKLRDGELVLKRERFKGTGNNAGLIGHFTLIDMNGDGIGDLVGGSVDYNVYCINGKDFSVLWEYNTGYENQMLCSFSDVNGDGIPDVFSVNDEYRLTVLDGRTGKLIHEMIVQESVKKGWNQTQVLLADLTGNGRLNVVVKGGWNRLRVFEIPSVSVPKNEIVWIPEP